MHNVQNVGNLRDKSQYLASDYLNILITYLQSDANAVEYIVCL